MELESIVVGDRVEFSKVTPPLFGRVDGILVDARSPYLSLVIVRMEHGGVIVAKMHEIAYAPSAEELRDRTTAFRLLKQFTGDDAYEARSLREEFAEHTDSSEFQPAECDLVELELFLQSRMETTTWDGEK